ncbi:MAG: TIGR00300 family protein [Planctomycetota bacterium]
MFHDTVTARGHLIDTHALERIFDLIVEHGARYEVVRFDVGRTVDETSELELRVSADDESTLREALEATLSFGCSVKGLAEARLETCDRDACVPEDFYSTTNHRTQVHLDGRWHEVKRQRMDAVIVVEDGVPSCRLLRKVRAGDRVVCGVGGVRVLLDDAEGERQTFAFMSSDISSERSVESSIARVADAMRKTRERGERIVVVAGPVVVHTGGIEPFSALLRGGWFDALLAGNAIAVHDIENSFFGTSLGVSLETGRPVEEGHKNHMRTINRINHAGSIPAAVESGVLTSGVMHACVESGVAFVLAGSIRDDGPLPDTVMDLFEAQRLYAEQLEGVGMVLMLSTMLHAIGVGNMLPSWVNVVCVDINPAVVTKLSDRGSSQTIGVVTDVGLFLGRLAEELAHKTDG